MSSHNLQQALAKAAAAVRDAHPELTPQDVHHAYEVFRQHFREREDEPPVSDQPAMDELLLALWDVIVDRETAGADEAEGELEDYYAEAFTQLLQPEEPALAETTVPIAMSTPVDENCDEPAEVVAETEETVDLPGLVEPEEDARTVIYKLKVSLDDGAQQPRIWRKLLVPAQVSQTELHHILQAVMGWRGTESFQFYPDQGVDLPSTGEPRLMDLIPSREKECGYEFDNWYHNVTLEEKLTARPNQHYPECIAGQGACPPEDIGGMPEYKRMLSALKDPTSPDYREMAGWITQDFNPDAFNIDQANTRLGKYGDTEFHAVV